ncbi:glucose-1-phosphate cytidylyltransferase [Patescibacteria group bacterium]|nr:glucose-1-phosphate cytidylyltransferase [Patescibacteria group bacterium]MBU4098097.1 glucose-1-phosphate cytidylyltransferase [Patescibacteria group bacterium]
MKTIILSGGLGYRLKEETEFKPKPMVNIGHKPILWHIMKIYSHYGFNDFIIALGYKGDYIKEYFLNQKYFMNDFTLFTKTGATKIHRHDHERILDDFKITFVDTGENTLPGERILRIKAFIPKEDEDFMVTYGDGVADIDIKELMKFHKQQKTIGTITSVHPTSRFGLLSVDKNNIVTRLNEKPVLKDWINGGFMVFNKKFFNYLKPNEMEHEGLKRLAKENQLSHYTHNGFWHSMDTYTDVKILNEMWSSHPKWKVWK